MPIISRSSIEEIRHKVNIYDVVSPVVGLKKVGANYRGLSPFSNEKTPSFYVLPDKNIFKCFSSGEAGDVFKFIQITERLNFHEAIESIASRFNIQLEYEKGSGKPGFKPSLRKEILEIHDLATEHYHRNFMSDTSEGKYIRDYWVNDRKFTLETAKEHKIGLALPNDPGFFAALKKKNFSDESLAQCGLFFPPRNPNHTANLYPRFRGRLMIPIREHANQRVIAFTARQLEITPQDDRSREAKYVNSPETPLFNKSSVLFGLYKSKKEVSEELPFILVEGQLDVIRCWTIGLPAVAPQGTAITEGQLMLLKRFNEQIICLLDGDSAGQKAALRALPLAWKAGIDIRYFPIPDKMDPDDLVVQEGSALLGRIKNESISALKFAVDSLLPNAVKATALEKNRTANSVFEMLTHLNSELMRMESLSSLGRLLGIREEILATDFKNYLLTKQRRSQVSYHEEAPENTGNPIELKSKLTNAEEDLILALFERPDLGANICQVLDNEWINDSKTSGRILNRILAESEHGTWLGVNHIDDILETEEERNYFFEIRSKDFSTDNFIKAVGDSILTLRKRYFQTRIQSIDAEISNLSNDQSDLIRTLSEQRRDLKRSINQRINLQLPNEL